MSVTPGWQVKLIQRIKPQKILISFFYFDGMPDEKIDALLTIVKENNINLMVDSGIFSLKQKYGKGIFSLGTSHASLTPAEQAETIQKYRADFSRYDEFRNRYLNFLTKYGNRINWAVDLDVDQFLGIDTAEEWYQDILKVFPSKRLLRVWHANRSFKEWEDWCKSGDFTYLAIEGAGSHGYDPDFYQPFIDCAHANGVRVHILAMTAEDMLRRCDYDTGDSTTYQVGARYGQIMTPWGFIYFSEKNEGAGKDNYFYLPEPEKKAITELLEENGFSVEAMMESNYSNTQKSAAGIERSAWNMFYQEKYLGSVRAVRRESELTLFDL